MKCLGLYPPNRRFEIEFAEHDSWHRFLSPEGSLAMWAMGKGMRLKIEGESALLVEGCELGRPDFPIGMIIARELLDSKHVREYAAGRYACVM